MDNTLAKFPRHTPPSPLPTLPDPFLAHLLEQAEASFRACRADATMRAYQGDWRQFCSWCHQNGLIALPAAPETAILYATDLAKNQKRRLATVLRRLSAISQVHHEMRFDSPTTTWEAKKFLAGLRRELGMAQRRKRPVSAADLRAIVAQMPASILGTRDRAILLVGFAGAFRRSEIAALVVDDCKESEAGLTITVRRSKTDQEGQGRVVGIPRGQDAGTCPVQAVEDWRQTAGIDEGPLFRRVNRHGQVLGTLSGQAVS